MSDTLTNHIHTLAKRNLTMKQAAERLQMGYTTLWKYCRSQGLGNPFKAAGKALQRAGMLATYKRKRLAQLTAHGLRPVL